MGIISLAALLRTPRVFFFRFFTFFKLFFCLCVFAFILYTMAEEQKPVKSEASDAVQLAPYAEKLTKTKKYQQMMDCKDLYSTPVSAIPGCGFLLGTLLKREGICRASDLYDRFKKENRKNFTSFLECKLGKWNAIYASVVLRALEDWQNLNDPKPVKASKKKEEAPQKPKVPHKVGLGSKKWVDFLLRTDLSKTSVRRLPGVAGVLGCELEKQGFKTAQQLMYHWRGDKKGQCNKDDALFRKWVLCTFGYWNTQYTDVVLAALKAYTDGHPRPSSVIQLANGEPTFMEKVANAAESAAEMVSEALADEETNENEVVKEEVNDNEDESGQEEENGNQDGVDQESDQDDGDQEVEKNGNQDEVDQDMEENGDQDEVDGGSLEDSATEVDDGSVDDSATEG